MVILKLRPLDTKKTKVNFPTTTFPMFEAFLSYLPCTGDVLAKPQPSVPFLQGSNRSCFIILRLAPASAQKLDQDQNHSKSAVWGWGFNGLTHSRCVFAQTTLSSWQFDFLCPLPEDVLNAQERRFDKPQLMSKDDTGSNEIGMVTMWGVPL